LDEDLRSSTNLCGLLLVGEVLSEGRYRHKQRVVYGFCSAIAKLLSHTRKETAFITLSLFIYFFKIHVRYSKKFFHIVGEVECQLLQCHFVWISHISVFFPEDNLHT